MSNVDLVIKRADVNRWYIDVDGVQCPVSIKLANNGWRFIPDNNVDHGEFTVVVRIRRVEYEVTADSRGNVNIYKLVEDGMLTAPIEELGVPRGHPAVKFFQMTGVGNDGIERTVCIDHTLSPQIYGTDSNA